MSKKAGLPPPDRAGASPTRTHAAHQTRVTAKKCAPRKPLDDRPAAYRAYRDAHGTSPKEADPIGKVRSLAGWLRRQRDQDRVGTLDPALSAALDAVNPQWRETTRSPAGRDRRVSQYREHWDTYGTDPKQADPDDKVRSLAGWLAGLRREDRAGTLDRTQGAAMDVVNPRWRETTHSPAGRDRRVAAYQAYRDAHGTDPKANDPDPAVRSLARWLTKLRVKGLTGTLDPTLGAALDEVSRHWRETRLSAAGKDRRVAEYQTHRDVHGTDPKNYDTVYEVRSLATWLRGRRREDRAGTLDPVMGAALDEVNPMWRATDNKVTTGRLVEFVKALLGSMSTLAEIAQLTVMMQDGVDAARAEMVVATVRKIRTGRAAIDEAEALIAAGNVDEADDATAVEVEVSRVVDGTDPLGTDEPEADRDVPVTATQIIDGAAAALAHLGRSHSTDVEAYEFLVAAPVNQMWAQAYAADPAELAALIRETDDVLDNVYAETVRAAFREQLDAALACNVPDGWSFKPDADGPVVAPNLMQRHVATQIVKRRRLGNWSGTGAGKTVSAVLAARLDGAGTSGVVLVVCPNAVVANWYSVARSVFPGTRVETKTLHPTWEAGDGPRWLVVNYEMLSDRREGQIRDLIEPHGVDMLIVDEVHFAKVRKSGRAAAGEASQRRQVLEGIATHVFKGNPDAALLAMSATPVVNELYEAISLLELVEGTELKDLAAKPTVTNCVKVHQHLVRFGVRFKPEDAAAPDITFVPVDATHLTDELIAAGAGRRGSALAIEQVMVQAKIPTIVDAALAARSRGKRTLVYTELVDGIVEPIKAALEDAGLRVGQYTGEDKGGLSRILGFYADNVPVPVPAADQVDVLVGSISISTGVDGLQKVVDTLVFAGLPWTHAGWEQVIGRVLRQGQTSDRVRVVTPICTVTEPNGDATSPDTIRRGLIRNKRTLAEAVTNGTLPTSQGLVSSDKIGKKWLARLAAGQEVTVTRELLDVRLGDDVDTLTDREAAARFGELSDMNSAWGSASSATTHERLGRDRTEFDRYHRLYTRARSTWDVVPAHRFAAWLNERPAGKVVADLGCGQNLLAAATTTTHDIRGFDHVAFDDTVTVCDIAHTPLLDGSVDVAVLSLALMGLNHADYLVEARRILHPGGELWLAEPASSVGGDEDRLRVVLKAYGFALWNVEVSDRFTILQATRSAGRLADVLPPIKGVERRPLG